MSSPVPPIDLDTTGLCCPEPLMLLHQAMRRAQPGQVIAMRATDPSTWRDVPKFCAHLGHTLLAQAQQDDPQPTVYRYQIQKKQPHAL